MSVPVLEAAFQLLFQCVDFRASFVRIGAAEDDVQSLTFSQAAVRVGRFVVETDLPWQHTVQGFQQLVAGLVPHATICYGHNVIFFMNGEQKAVVSIYQLPGTS
jgi:hypothetical protein